MTNYDLRIPEEWACIVRGALYSSNDPDDLSENMVEVRLPNGVLVCAGWCDIENRYVITVALHGRLIIQPSYTESPLVAVDQIVERVGEFRRRNINMSITDDTDQPPRLIRLDPATNQLMLV